MKIVKLILLGLVAGFISAAFGIGGGVIIMAALILLFGYDMKRAIAPSLVSIIPQVAVAVTTYLLIQAELIVWRVALITITGAIIGSRLGALFVRRIKVSVLQKAFAVLMFITGLKLVGLDIPTQSFVDAPALWLIVTGLLAGSGSALFGIGGGVIMVPAFNLFFGLRIQSAIATSLAVILPTVAAGYFFHRKLGKVDTDIYKYMVPASLFGAVLGAVTASLLPAAILKAAFGIFQVIISIKIFFQKIKSEAAPEP